MIGTLFSIVVVTFLWFHPYAEEMPINLNGMEAFMIAVSIPFLFITPIGTMMAWLPLQKAEQTATPHVLEMFPKDRPLAIVSAYLIAFALISFLTIPIYSMHEAYKTWLFLLWIVLLGAAIDAARYYVRRIISYINPLVVVQLFRKKALKSIQDEKELDLCHWIDGLSEVAIKGIQRHSTSLCHQALSDLQELARIFLEASKSIGHHAQDKQTMALGIRDKVSYIMFYFYQRLDVIYEIALRQKLEMTCSQLVNWMGKNSIDAAKYDISLASSPLRYLGKFARRAQEEGLPETTLTASCVLSEVAKTVLQEIDITYIEIKDAFLSIINSLEVLAKGAFQHDKAMSIALLTQPFQDLRALFDSGKAKDHQDRAIIVQNIDRILNEFEALQLVMNTIPPITNGEPLANK